MPCRCRSSRCVGGNSVVSEGAYLARLASVSSSATARNEGPAPRQLPRSPIPIEDTRIRGASGRREAIARTSSLGGGDPSENE
eukprot:scaffold2349_cov407-Prasinococcus_capsulatus_cf.AAC.5